MAHLFSLLSFFFFSKNKQISRPFFLLLLFHSLTPEKEEGDCLKEQINAQNYELQSRSLLGPREREHLAYFSPHRSFFPFSCFHFLSLLISGFAFLLSRLRDEECQSGKLQGSDQEQREKEEEEEESVFKIEGHGACILLRLGSEHRRSVLLLLFPSFPVGSPSVACILEKSRVMISLLSINFVFPPGCR